MIYFLWNLLLAIFWSAISGEMNIRNLLIGFIIGFIVLASVAKALEIESHFGKTRKLIALVFMMVRELVKSSLQIAFDIITPTHYMRPGIIKIKLDARTPAEITLFSNMLTLTPGTLSLDVSDDGEYLFVHVMYIKDTDIELVKTKLKQRFELPLLELMR